MNRDRRYGSGRLWQRGKTWVLDWRDEHSKRRRQHLGPNKRDAERQRVELVARRDRIFAGLDTLPQNVTLAELRDRYVEDLATRTTEMHVRNVEPVLARWLEVLPALKVREVQPADVLAFRARLLNEGRAAQLLPLAHHVERLVEAGEVESYAEAAFAPGLTRTRLTQVLALTGLSPRVQERILMGDLDVTDHALRPMVAEVEWARQGTERCGLPLARSGG